MAKAGACSARLSTAKSATNRPSARAQAHAGAQEFLRTDRFAVDPGFVVQMRTGRPAGRSDCADDLADLEQIADLHADLGQMAVAGRKGVAVSNCTILRPRSVKTPRIRRTRDSMLSSTEFSAAIWRLSTLSSEVCRRTRTLSTP